MFLDSITGQSITFALILPTHNPGSHWNDWIEALSKQTILPDQVLIIDSESNDGTLYEFSGTKFDVFVIPKKSFNHGGTRDVALHLLDPSIDLVVFMTQDAILTNVYSLELLVNAFKNPDVAAAYGRQLPHKCANPFAVHARNFNYGVMSELKSIDLVPKVGIKTCFISNSFAAYRISDLLEVGSFPQNIILGEDMYVAGKIILSGKKIQYVADACVNHSHDYSMFEEFRRYFDTGVFHSMEPWLIDNFGKASGEGMKFVRSELKYLLTHKPSLFPQGLLNSAFKLLGYKLGLHHKVLPRNLVIFFSMHKGFWVTRKAS